MSWPIGYGLPKVEYRGDIAGTIYANSHPVTDPGGWMDLPAPRLSGSHATDQEISIRLRVAYDATKKAFLYAEEVEIGGQRFAGLHSLVAREGTEWLNYLVEAIHSRMVERLASPESATPREARVHTKPLPADGEDSSRSLTPFPGIRAVTPPGKASVHGR